MGKAILYYWKQSAIITGILFVFCMLGFMALLLPNDIAQMLVGLVMCFAPVAALFFIGRTQGQAAFKKGKKIKEGTPPQLAAAQSYRIRNGGYIGIMFCLPILFYMLIAIMFNLIFPDFVLLRGFLTFFFSGFSAVLSVLGFEPALMHPTSSLIFLAYMALCVGMFWFGYCVGGIREEKQYRELQQEIKQFGGR